jgi:hypothetical protein
LDSYTFRITWSFFWVNFMCHMSLGPLKIVILWFKHWKSLTHFGKSC